MANAPHPPAGGNLQFGGEELTTVSYRKRQLVMYPVQKHEFEILASGYSSIHLGLAGCFFGAAITIGVTIGSVALPEAAHRVFTDCLIITIIATLYCGLMAIRDYRNSKKVVGSIRSETIDVVVGQTTQQ
jgi:hypothetical protein